MTRKIYDQSNNFSHYQSLYYLFDNLGSVVAITDDSGKPVQYYQYDPYGQITNTTNDPVNNITFVGRYFGQADWDTGFIYFWHRWYDSQNGRWINKDPIGVKGGYNLYEYVGGNPGNKRDIYGLSPSGARGLSSGSNGAGVYSGSCNNPDDPNCELKYLDQSTTDQLTTEYVKETFGETAVFSIVMGSCYFTGPAAGACVAIVEIIEKGVFVYRTLNFLWSAIPGPVPDGFGDWTHV